MKDMGFRKKQQVYENNLIDLTWFVNIQKSRWNDETECQFTLNCGVFIPGVLSKYANVIEPAKPKIDHCCCAARIGMLTPEKLDKWWKIKKNESDSADDEIGQDIKFMINQFVIPFLNKFTAPMKVADFLSDDFDDKYKQIFPTSKAQRLAYAAIIYSLIGERQKALDILDFAIAVSIKTPINETITDLKNKLKNHESGT
jgi:hypothetical protein